MPSPGDDSYGKRQVRHRACDRFTIPLELPHRRLLSLDGPGILHVAFGPLDHLTASHISFAITVLH